MALTANRDTERKVSPFDMVHEHIGIDSDEFYKGALLMFDQSDARIKPAAAITDGICMGRCMDRVSTGASNTKRVRAESGIFQWGQTGTTITRAHIGVAVYAADDQTVTLSSSGASKVGVVYDVDAKGVWVATTFPATAGV